MIRPKQLNGLTLAVRDLERSLAWYREKFGFEKLFDDAPNSNGVIIGIIEDPDGHCIELYTPRQ